jgi:hypothetical protein
VRVEPWVKTPKVLRYGGAGQTQPERKHCEVYELNDIATLAFFFFWAIPRQTPSNSTIIRLPILWFSAPRAVLGGYLFVTGLSAPRYDYRDPSA